MHVNLAVLCLAPLTPTGFRITNEYYAVTNVIVTFEWDYPPKAIVDSYRITISSPRLSPTSEYISTTIRNATLNYNQTYAASITAINCAGESGTLLLPSTLEYSKCDNNLVAHC